MTGLAVMILLFTAGSLATGLTLAGRALWGPRAQARRRLRRGPTEIADRSIVTLQGTVRSAGVTVAAALSGRECVAYVANARVFFRTRAGRNELLGIAEQHEAAPFELVLADGRIVAIEAQRVSVVARATAVIPRRLERDRAFLVAHGYEDAYVGSSAFEEAAIAEGDRISVQGLALVEHDSKSVAERGYRDAPPHRIRLVDHEHPLVIDRA